LPSETLDVEKIGQGVSELDELLLSIGSSITHLFGLSILIRRQRPRGRVPCLDSFEPLRQSPDITNVTDKFPKTKQHSWLAVRVGNATARRREIIRYRQLHRERIGKRKADYGQVAEASASAYSETLATTFEGTIGNNASPDVAPHSDEGNGRMSIFTSATSFASLTDDSNMGYQIPDLSDMILEGVQLEYGVEFECPYCRTIQVLANRFEWKLR